MEQLIQENISKDMKDKKMIRSNLHWSNEGEILFGQVASLL